MAQLMATRNMRSRSPHFPPNHLKIESMAFAPSTITLKRGEKVVWRNADLVPHTATAAGRFDSGNIAPGKSWTYTAGEPGRYDYVCTYHPGMKAALVVQ